MQLSDQAIGAIMMALQESLMHQSDIVPVFQGFELEDGDDGLVVKNPPTVHVAAEEITPPEITGV
jgi:hypothetical protein|tara:strand:- start:216 stop:410 length:195 start_codon:yes stop_codon:yes gene_type:complete